MGEYFAIVIYRFIFTPVALTFLFFLIAPFNRKVRKTLWLRISKYEDKFTDFPPELRPIWIHAASGEFEYAKPILRELKHRHPELPTLVTYFSPSYKRQVQNSPYVDYSCPLPLDLPGAVSSFLSHVQPRCLLIARTDLWPELLFQCKQRNIPRIGFAFVKTRLKLVDRFLGWFKSLLLNQLTHLIVTSDNDRENFLKMGISVPTDALGDPRYDEVLFRLHQQRDFSLNLPPPTPTTTDTYSILVAGSTWPEDEQVLLPAVIDRLREKKILVVLAPHEPSESHYLKTKSAHEVHSIAVKKFSEMESSQIQAGEILYVDTIGVLIHLYQSADFAFVGGSFKKKVHSVMEPLAAGRITLVGPHHENHREAVDFQKVMTSLGPAVQVSHNGDELKAQIDHLIQADHTEAQKKIRQQVELLAGASHKIVTLLIKKGMV